MKTFTRTLYLSLIAAIGVASVCAAVGEDEALKAQKPITIAGGPGAFDWMRIDARSNRVFATHKGTKTVAVVDPCNRHWPLPSATVGTAQGIAIDRRDNKIFLGDEAEHKVVIVDYATLKKTGEIAVTGPVDDVLYCGAESHGVRRL